MLGPHPDGEAGTVVHQAEVRDNRASPSARQSEVERGGAAVELLRRDGISQLTMLNYCPKINVHKFIFPTYTPFTS